MMIAYNSNEDSPHTDVAWFLWYAADSAHALGQLVSIDYSDSTPDVAFTYDRLGRQLTVTDVLGTRTNVYDALNLLEERHPDGTALVRSYDPYGRAAGISLGPDYAVGYGYDEYGRFSTVAVSNGATFTYSYVPNSSLLSGYTNDLGLAVAYEYEPHRDVKTLVSNAWGTNVISTFAYTYDAIGRRTVRIDDSSTTNLFGYNLRSELTSALMGTNTYAYAYDSIGNRLTSTENGTTTTYAANALNQYTALNPASSNPTPFTYDPDGNMTSDGTFFYQYDAINQLTNVIRSIDGVSVVQSRYDAIGRCVETIQEVGLTNHYIYYPDSFLVLTVRDEHNVCNIFYIRGLDLSGSLDGAGGIGGILATMDCSGATRYFHADSMGNVIALTGAFGDVLASFRYAPYGQLSMLSGPGISGNLFNSKELNDSIGLYSFGYRYYSPQLGRWMTRDPLGGAKSLSLYDYLKNNTCNAWDAWGLTTVNEILAEFFSPISRERIWIMPEEDEYTKYVKNWDAVQELLDKWKKDMETNCCAWKNEHLKMQSQWNPSMISPPIFDPNAKTEWVPAPEGTEPDDVQQAVMDSISNLNTSDELWTSVIGSFGIGVTVSSIDCENHSVVLDIWMYNCMSHQSLGRFATNTLFSLSGQRNQYMWWNWQEEHTWK